MESETVIEVSPKLATITSVVEESPVSCMNSWLRLNFMLRAFSALHDFYVIPRVIIG